MKEFLDNQHKNLFLWTPFLIAFGAALYFSLDTEPDFHFPIIISFLLALIIYKRKNIFVRAISLFLFGFFYSMSFTNILNTPQIKDSFGEVEISGKITDIDYTSDSTRLIIKVPINQIDSKYLDNKNINIRISLKETSIKIKPGDTIKGNALIFHPSPKYAPDSFDFSRWAYFKKISGTGFFKDYQIIPSNSKNNHIRNFIHDATKSKLTDALILGYKKSIPDNEVKKWQSIGLGHIWSISGFHLTLVGGWMFALFYFIFRLFAPITKRIPAKYPAMICAWGGLLFYLFMSGISVATIRAFIMTSLIFIAALFSRGILSLRNVALAFVLIFLINPYYIMNAGFQLSFAAIFGIVWWFRDENYIKRNFINRIWYIVSASLITATIATLFTLPFVIAHFGFIPLYSLIGNLLLLPIFSFVIMPLIMIGTLLALFGNGYFLYITDIVYQHSLKICDYISNMPNAYISVPHISNTALIIWIIGMMCIILIVNPDSKKFILKHLNYVIGCCFIFIALFIFIATPRPMFYTSDDHKLAGFVVGNEILFNKSKSSKHYFAFNTWRKFNNEIEKDKNRKYKCKSGLCIYKTQKWNIAYMQNFTAVMDNIENLCDDENLNFIVSVFDITPQKCHAKILKDGILIYPSGRVKNFSNRRPWHNLH
jgi:ComEC/Rec2-related protein